MDEPNGKVKGDGLDVDFPRDREHAVRLIGHRPVADADRAPHPTPGWNRCARHCWRNIAYLPAASNHEAICARSSGASTNSSASARWSRCGATRDGPTTGAAQSGCAITHARARPPTAHGMCRGRAPEPIEGIVHRVGHHLRLGFGPKRHRVPSGNGSPRAYFPVKTPPASGEKGV